MGCASAPDLAYYTLDMTPSDPVDSQFHIEVGRMRASRAEIMILSAPTQVEYYATQQWAADLGDIVREKLTSEFGEAKRGPAQVQLEGNILRFGQVDTETGADAEIKIEFTAKISEPQQRMPTLFRKTYVSRITADDASADAVVRALSLGLEQIAAEFERDIQPLVH